MRLYIAAALLAGVTALGGCGDLDPGPRATPTPTPSEVGADKSLTKPTCTATDGIWNGTVLLTSDQPKPASFTVTARVKRKDGSVVAERTWTGEMKANSAMQLNFDKLATTTGDEANMTCEFSASRLVPASKS